MSDRESFDALATRVNVLDSHVTSLRTSARVVAALVLTSLVSFVSGGAWVVTTTLQSQERIRYLDERVTEHRASPSHAATRDDLDELRLHVGTLTARYEQDVRQTREAIQLINQTLDRMQRQQRR